MSFDEVSFDEVSYIQFLKVFLPTYAKLNDYLHKIGVSETSKCSCGEVETIEHYLLHCENYFNERERMRRVLFQQTGIADLTLDAGITDIADLTLDAL